MQRSFSIVHDDDDDLLNEEKISDIKSLTYRPDVSSESDDNISSPKRTSDHKLNKPEALPRQKVLSAGPSRSLSSRKTRQLLSDSEDSDNEERFKHVPGQYDFKEYEKLDVDDEIKEVFQYILKYSPQELSLDNKFKPFTPEFLPAVGDIDAFLKVIPPETTLSGNKFDEHLLQLGLVVLDEPASNQSDPALLHLQLRAASGTPSSGRNKDAVIKKVDNLEKNSKVIEKWIKDISHLHKSKTSPFVRYSENMPDIDDLLQEWSEEKEHEFNKNGFPKCDGLSLSEYTDIVCKYLGIPVGKNKIESLHLLFCLYTAMKQTQLYKSTNNDKRSATEEKEVKNEADQLLVLD